MKKIILFLFLSLCLTSTPSKAKIIKSHGVSLFGDLAYDKDFKHFKYVNPDAPKGGQLVTAASSNSFDSLNSFIAQGTPAAGLSLTRSSLMSGSWDEINSVYCELCRYIEYPEDRSWVVFHLRDDAYFHDGSPITVEDVLFSFDTMKAHHPSIQIFLKDVDKVEITGKDKIKFTFRNNKNREMLMLVGSLSILSKKYWEKRDISKVTLEPSLGSGPYKIKSLDAGRSITYERVKDFWGKDHPVYKGLYNFDEIQYDYYRDQTVKVEAFKAQQFDLRFENSAKNWATAYDIDEVKNGKLIRKKVFHQQPETAQGWAFNLRQPLFKNRQVRKAITLAYDFEWQNRKIFYNLYKRTRSYWQNSVLEAKDLPKGKELELLNNYKENLPNEVFEKEFRPPQSNGRGHNRSNLRKAQKILAEQGWTTVNNTLTHKETGQKMTFDILVDDKKGEELSLPFVKNLKKLGIQVNIKRVDTPRWINLVRKFDFDMTLFSVPNYLTPGSELRVYWGSKSAQSPGARNIIGVENKVVDQLIEQVISSKDKTSLTTSTRALDRVLQWGYYMVPQFHAEYQRLLYWNKFSMPQLEEPTLRGVNIMTWWVDIEKAKSLK